MLRSKIWPLSFFISVLLFSSITLVAQDTSKGQASADTSGTQNRNNFDSARFANQIDSARRAPESGGQRRKISDTVLVTQLNLMERYANRLGQMSAWFARGIDTASLAEEIGKVEDQLRVAKAGIAPIGEKQNLRNLNATRVLMVEIEKHLERWQKELSDYNREVVSMRIALDTMFRDSVLRVTPKDSLLAQQYITRVTDLVKRYLPLDSSIRKTNINLGLLQGRVIRSLLDVKDNIYSIDQSIKQIRKYYFKRDEPPLWKFSASPHSTFDVLSISGHKGKLVLQYYFSSTSNITYTAVLLFITLFLALSFMIRRLKAMNKDFLLYQLAPHLNTSVFFSSLFLAVTVAQLFYANIPMVFLQIAWLIMVGSALFLFRNELRERWKGVWMGFAFLFLWACLENLLLEATLVERIIMLMASVTGLVLAFRLIRNYKLLSDKPNYYKFFIYLFIVQEAVAIVANIWGSYTFGRAMAVGGFFNLTLGFLVFQAIVVFKEMLVVSYEYYQRNNVLGSMLNLLELKRSAERILPVIAWIGWFIIFAKNLNFYDILLRSTITFLSEPRKLGNVEFTFSSVAIFFLTIWISTVLAKLVAFLLGGGSQQVGSIKKTRFGSSILVLKLVIISLGLLVAFAASGIPMDKITIIIGALGVGIGFGLQTIVNNLVSGIILAFEKPIEIGDQIEVGGRLGKVKEIGIRSSKLATFEGAEVIIPNGDLLSQHVVNWTLSHNHRRVEILVGVSYGSQLGTAKEVLEKILLENELVDKSPAPAVLVHQFNSSSIDFRLLFWTDIEQWISCKSEIIMAIDKAFKEQGIEIPFAQMVVHQAKQ